MRKLIGISLATAFVAATYVFAQDTPTGQAVYLTGGVVTVSAGRTELMGNGTAWSGGVVITANGARITADRAVVEVSDIGNVRPEEIRIEGNVRLSLPKQP